MKIGIVFDDSVDRVDGVQQYVKILGRYFMQRGHTVHFLVGESDPSLNPDLTIHSLAKNLSVKANQNRLTIPLPSSSSQVKALLNKEQYDVLHVQVPYSPFMSGKVIAHAPKETAVVGTFHIVAAGFVINTGAKLLSILQGRTKRRFDAWVAVSTAAQDFALSAYGIEMPVVPNPVKVSDFANKKPFQELSDKQNIVYINRLVERKGCAHLIEAVHDLNQRGKFKDRRLIVCGKGPLKESLEQKVKDYGLSEKVQFAGFISEDDKPRYLASARLACYPSTGGESFGIVLTEAMAAGALTLGGNNVGYASVLGEQPKLLVDPKDTRVFADRIDELMSDEKLRSRLLAWQKASVGAYDQAAVGDALLKIYEEVASK